MDENKEAVKEPKLTISSYVNDKHILEDIPYSSLTMEKLVELAVSGDKTANEELIKKYGVDILKDPNK